LAANLKRTFNAVVAGSIPARLTIVFNTSRYLQILSSTKVSAAAGCIQR
jgi:hypothetical protein